MTNYLLDTHIFLNAYIKPEKIGKRITKIISSDTKKYISAVTLIEIAQLFESKPKEFKIAIPLAQFIDKALDDLKVEVLNISSIDTQRFYEINLMKDHQDQYDRMIIAQGSKKNFVVLSDDRKFPFYPIEIINNEN